jgi:hypothetical protein
LDREIVSWRQEEEVLRPERVPVPLVPAGMAIDKESTGLPEVDLSRRTTKVNLWIIVAVGVFFVAMGGVIIWLSNS